jgi:hypothetical protein
VAVTRRVIVEALMVEGFIDSLNDTVTVLLRSTSAAPFVGTTDTTVGGVMSAVVNVVEKGDASEFPSTSRRRLSLPECIRSSPIAMRTA